VPATIALEHFGGYLGPLRVLLSDLVVFMMGAGPSSGPDNLSALYPLARRLSEGIRISVAELEPVALGDVRGKDAFFCTTAHRGVAASLADRLERTSGCRVIGISASLADRSVLEADLAAAPPYDVLLTELKAAAVDVAARRALDRGAEVAFVDNRPRTAGGDGEVDELLRATITSARERGHARRGGAP
jgi:cyclic 2,3-diphosphoglycerate synthase